MCPRERVHRASGSIAPVSVFAALHKFIVCAFAGFDKFFCNDGSPNCHRSAIMLISPAHPLQHRCINANRAAGRQCEHGLQGGS
jgi:hypothetical protein